MQVNTGALRMHGDRSPWSNAAANAPVNQDATVVA